MDKKVYGEVEYGVKESRSSKLPLVGQEKAISELHETISFLTDRLQAVLTPVPESDGSEPSNVAAPMQSQLADTLDSNNASIRRATMKLSNLIDRVEC